MCRSSSKSRMSSCGSGRWRRRQPLRNRRWPLKSRAVDRTVNSAWVDVWHWRFCCTASNGPVFLQREKASTVTDSTAASRDTHDTDGTLTQDSRGSFSSSTSNKEARSLSDMTKRSVKNKQSGAADLYCLLLLFVAWLFGNEVFHHLPSHNGFIPHWTRDSPTQ